MATVLKIPSLQIDIVYEQMVDFGGLDLQERFSLGRVGYLVEGVAEIHVQ